MEKDRNMNRGTSNIRSLSKKEQKATKTLPKNNKRIKTKLIQRKEYAVEQTQKINI
ncbi:hypothetical protein WA026_002345, partial [Henosepilachna vigintioctopunctata]